MNQFWEGLQWVFSAGGAIGAVATYFLYIKIEKQKHNLDKLKTKFNYLILKRNEVIAQLNGRISDIEIWMKQTSKLEDSDFIHIRRFKELVDKFEVTLIHGRYLLPARLKNSVDALLALLCRCIETYEDELEKIGFESVPQPPEIAFANELYKPEIEESIKSAKWFLGQELAEE